MRRSASKIGQSGLGHSRNYLFGRTANLRIVQRRIVLWTVLVFVLIGAAALQIVANREVFTAEAAIPGGTYAEGAIGPLGTLNPILAESSSELSVSRLLFSGLFDYDQTGALRPRLATSITTDDAKTYTINLRQNLTWSDGEPFTSADVVFTVGLIQDESVRSPLAADFRNVVVSAVNPQTVQMVLPAAYAPFAQSLTFGIVPKHILGSVDPSAIRGNQFNVSPVTLGPFTFSSLREQDANGNAAVYLSANPDYFGGAPLIDHFQLHVYKDQTALLRAYTRREVGAIAGASVTTAQSAVKRRAGTTVTNAPLNNADYALFNTKSDLYADSGLRAAIRQGTDVAAVRSLIGGGVRPLNGPVLASQVPEVASLTQATGDLAGARSALDALGWKVGSNGVRSKDGQSLIMRFVAIDSGDYPKVAHELARQWTLLGIDVRLDIESADSARERVLTPRAYDVLLYELSIGGDPDVYAYWHSSQNGTDGFNLSGYSSVVADDNLLSARAVLDPALRQAKYVAFAKQWLIDTPAIALYQQAYHYVSGDQTEAIPADSTLVTPTDRFAQVTDWTTDSTRQFITP